MAAHALLLAILVVGSAFMKPPAKPEPTRFIKLFDASKITDDETKGGGNPNVPSDATPPPAAQFVPPAPQEPPIRQEAPPPKLKTVETPPKKKKTVEPPPVEVKKPESKPEKTETPKFVKRPEATKVVPKKNLVEKPPETKPDKKFDIDLTPQKYKPDPDAERQKAERQRAIKEEKRRQEEERQAAERAQAALIEAANKQHRDTMAALGTIVGKVDTGLAKTTNIEMPGPGGEAFINYADLIYTRYYQAWQTPDGRDVRNAVKVEIVVARDGRVISSNVIRTSGDSVLDKSVRQALDRVTKLPAFPEGAKDAQRTFRINFELKSKRQFG